MTISIAGRLLKSEDHLSEKARIILSQIDGGTEWLRGTLADRSADHRFADESALIARIREAVQGSQTGLASATAS